MTTAHEIPSIDLTVEGMTCEGCATSIRSALTATDGVVSADIDVASGRLSVHPDGTVDRGTLEFAIDGVVHDVGYSVAS